MGRIVEVIVSHRKPKEGLQETEKRDKIAVFLPFAGGNWREMLAYCNAIREQGMAQYIIPIVSVTWGRRTLLSTCCSDSVLSLLPIDYEHHMMQQGGLREATISLQRRQV